jgi:hypothetical protein
MDLSAELLRALDSDKDGDWDEAHRIVQKLEYPLAYLVHAHLHREEGDLSNASYWYNRANRPMPDVPLAEEWSTIYEEIAG